MLNVKLYFQLFPLIGIYKFTIISFAYVLVLFVVYKMIEILYKSICVVLHHVWKAQWLRVTRFSQIVACLPFVPE